MGQAGARQPLGGAHDLLVLGQRRALDALRLPAVRRRLLPAVRPPLRRMAGRQVAAGDDGGRARLARRRRRRDAPGDRQVGQQHRRDPEGRSSSSRSASAASCFAIRHGAANTINGSSFVPSFGITKEFLPVIVFLLLGFELISSMAGEVKEPEKRIPRAIFTSGAVDRVPLHVRDDRHPAGAVADQAEPRRRPRRNVQGDLRHDGRRQRARIRSRHRRAVHVLHEHDDLDDGRQPLGRRGRRRRRAAEGARRASTRRVTRPSARSS